MVKRYVSYVLNTLDELEKLSTIEINDEKKYYFSSKFSIFENDILPARSIEEKIYNVQNTAEIISIMKERVEDIELAVDAALCYITCKSGDEQ